MTAAKNPAEGFRLDGAAIVATARAEAFQTLDQAAAFAYFRPLVAQIESPPPTAARYHLVRTNVFNAVAQVEPHLELAASRLVGAPIREVLELPSLALALTYAASRVSAPQMSAGEIAEALAALRPLREVTLAYLEVVSHPLVKLVPAERVRVIRAGTGPADQAQDGVSICGVFDEYAGVLEGKHPFTPAQLASLNDLGGSLVMQLRAKGALPTPPPTATPADEAALLRDRLEALLTERYEQLRLLATVALGPKAAALAIPPLRSGDATSAPTPTPTPTEGDAPKG